jgi:hypothetical protein
MSEGIGELGGSVAVDDESCEAEVNMVEGPMPTGTST